MIAFTCSGTGGHIYPALAMAQHIKQCDVLFIIEKDRIAADIIPKYKYPCTYFKFSKKNMLSFVKAIVLARKIFKKNKITRLMSTGGYATVPIALAAWSLGIPVVLHEQNTVPGRANRFLSVFAKKVCISFNYSSSYFKNHAKVVYTGNPIRKQYPVDIKCQKVMAYPWAPGKRLLVFGGSQGANAINRFIQKQATFFENESINLLHITGASYYKEHYKEQPMIIGYDNNKQVTRVVIDYIEDMKQVYLWCDYVISRAGATSIAELCYYNKPALLIPFPYATDNHQEINAKELTASGRAMMVGQADLDVAILRNLFEHRFEVSKSKYFIDYNALFEY